MKCEECLPRIEEYVDGELNGRIQERVAAHLSTCANCESEFAELRRDEEIYAHYRREVEVTPAQWEIIRKRIEQEKDAALKQPRKSLRAWLRDLFGSSHFRPGLVAALLLISIGIIIGLFYLNSRSHRTELAARPAKQNEAQPPADAAKDITPSVLGNQENETIAADKDPAKNNNPDRQRQTITVNTARAAAVEPVKKKNTFVAALPNTEKHSVRRLVPDEPSPLIEAVADRDQSLTGARRSAQEPAGNFDSEIARHAERAELLLRSFRNVRLPARARVLDVSYEKENARKLLYRNIALRRDASERGDQPTAELLNKLEPILLDIANLRSRAGTRDVRAVEEHMEKQEIVATLQVRTLLASN
ncbi:MAG TPA: zf-HC2 domain-containing protein [Pyrinomonadaceae bacterium]|nr:zf-HC2 domain-containing protein [Pyrinomonadaceae bacterium]